MRCSTLVACKSILLSSSPATMPWLRSNAIHTRYRYFPMVSMRSMTEIPFVDKKLLSVKFARSSGPGGQHVNKTESKVDMRVNVSQLDLPEDVRSRLMSMHSNKINKDQELVVTSESSRTRQRNYEECLEKLANIFTEISVEPAVRNMISKTKDKFNAHRLMEKKHNAFKKESRRRRDNYD